MIEKRIRELEIEFVIWSNILDDELMRYHYNRGSYSREYLLDEDKSFHGLLNDLDRKNEEYLCRVGAKFCHPNFEKCSWRLNRILDLIDIEIDSRKYK